MFHVVLLSAFLTLHAAPISIEKSLAHDNGLTYIQAAEDLLQDGNLSNSSLQLVKELYVLAAIIEPMYRESALLGIISIEKDAQRIARLHNLRFQSPLLVSNIIHNKQFSVEAKYDTIQICSTLSSLRKGRILKTEDVDSLRPWSYLFTRPFNQLLQKSLSERTLLQSDELSVSLQVELAVLGGANAWSADAATTGDRPVVLNISDDLASLVGVDPTKRIRRNGKWVQN